MGIQRFSKFLSWAEDTSINFIIFNFAKTFKYVHKYGIAHFLGKNTASNRQRIDSKIFGDVFFLDIIFDFSRNNTEDKNLIIGQALYILYKYKKYNITKYNSDINSIYFKSVLNKIFHSKYLNKLNKRKLKGLFSSFLFFN